MKNLKSNISEIFTLFFVLFLFIGIRIISIFLTPLELSADEGQYWLWSNELNWGYFSKPPMIAWVISLSTFLISDQQFGIRIFAPLFHGFTGLTIYILVKKLSENNRMVSLTSLLIWLSMPIIGVGSFIMSTDTPLMFFWSLGLLSIFYAQNSNKNFAWSLSGGIAGLAMLTKYAAVFLPLGLLLWFLFGKKKLIKINSLIFYILGFLIIWSPNLIWNLINDFSTISHLSDNAVINAPNFSLIGSVFFLSSQLFVLGPILFFVSIISIWGFWKDSENHHWLGWFAAPVYILMTIQGFFSEANANWAATALPSLTIFCSIFLKNVKLLSILGIFLNILISLFIVLVVIKGSFNPINLNSDPLRRLKGWEILASNIKSIDYKYIVVNRRGIAAPLIYYLRESDLQVRVVSSVKNPANYYQKKYPFNSKESDKFLFVSEIKESFPFAIQEFKITPLKTLETKISKDKERKLYFFHVNRK